MFPSSTTIYVMLENFFFNFLQSLRRIVFLLHIDLKLKRPRERKRRRRRETEKPDNFEALRHRVRKRSSINSNDLRSSTRNAGSYITAAEHTDRDIAIRYNQKLTQTLSAIVQHHYSTVHAAKNISHIAILYICACAL